MMAKKFINLQTNQCLFGVIILTAIIICILYVFGDQRNKLQEQNMSSTENVFELDLEKSSKATRIIYNMVPKCGSQTLRTAINQLAKKNNYTVQNRDYTNPLPLTMPYHVNESEVFKIVDKELSKIKDPWVYYGHLHFVNFEQYGLHVNVSYFNVIRDPVERLISFFYFRKYFAGGFFYPKPLDLLFKSISSAEKGHRLKMTYDECVFSGDVECTDSRFTFSQLPHFCGQDPHCIVPSQKSLQQAKRNVETQFTIVGYLERYPDFLKMLEIVYPQFFTGIAKKHESIVRTQGHHETKPHAGASEEAKEAMRQHYDIELELEFYKFVKQRFDILCKKYIYTHNNATTVLVK